VNIGGALQWSRERPNSTLSNWNISSTVELQQAQRILCAVTYIGVATNARHREEIQLWSHDRAGNRQSII
jgi:hypothetical protein